jgi:plastocyanin
MRRIGLTLAVALAGTLAACGGGGGGSSSSSGGGGAAVASSCPSGAVMIHMKDIKFDPAAATAKVGQKVCWMNEDDVQHDAVAKSGADFKSPLFGKGQAYTATVSKAGTVSYVCTVHPAMTATLDVKP